MSGLPPNIPPALLLQILQMMRSQTPGMGANPTGQPAGAAGTLPGTFGGAMPAGGGAGQIPPNILQGMQAAAAAPLPQQTLNPTSAMQAPGALGTMPGAAGAAMPMGTPGGNQPTMPTPAGARMPSMKKGGMVKKTGPHLLHKGERVVPATKVKKEKTQMRSRRPAMPRVRRRRLVPRVPMVAPGPGLGAPSAGPGLPMAGGPPGGPPGMPSMKKGGTVKKTGPHKLHKGEKVVPKSKAKDMGAATKRGAFPAKGKKKR